MDYNETLDELNATLDDTEDVTFTPEQKQRALTKAWNDSHVVKTVWDTTLTFDQNTYQYTVPTALTTVKDIYISTSNTTMDFPEPIDSDMWEVIDGNIQFVGANIIPQGWTLYCKGNKKITVDDTLDTTNLQEYVIALAGYNCLTALSYKKVNLFLKNDTTLSELIGLRRELGAEVKELRAKLQKDYEMA